MITKTNQTSQMDQIIYETIKSQTKELSPIAKAKLISELLCDIGPNYTINIQFTPHKKTNPPCEGEIYFEPLRC